MGANRISRDTGTAWAMTQRYSSRPLRAVGEDGSQGAFGAGPEQGVIGPGQVIHVQRPAFGDPGARQPVELDGEQVLGQAIAKIKAIVWFQQLSQPP